MFSIFVLNIQIIIMLTFLKIVDNYGMGNLLFDHIIVADNMIGFQVEHQSKQFVCFCNF